MNTSKYILFEGIQYRNRFITLNDSTKPESEKVKVADGSVAYIILGYADSIPEAQNKLWKLHRKPSPYEHEVEPVELIGYLIVADRDENKIRRTSEYYSIDHKSGGYPYWTSHINQAVIFATKKQAIDILENDSCFKDSTKMSNGTKYPPRMIHIAAGISNINPKGTVTISVSPLIIGKAVMSKEFTGEIIRPKSVVPTLPGRWET